MPEQQVDDAGLPAGGLQRRQTRGPGTIGQRCAGCEAVQRDYARRDAETGQRGGGGGGLGGGARAQSMIDDEGKNGTARGAGPLMGQDSEGEAVAAAGDAKTEPRRRAERPQGLKVGRELGCGDGLCQQPSRWCSEAIGCAR